MFCAAHFTKLGCAEDLLTQSKGKEEGKKMSRLVAFCEAEGKEVARRLKTAIYRPSLEPKRAFAVIQALSVGSMPEPELQLPRFILEEIKKALELPMVEREKIAAEAAQVLDTTKWWVKRP